MGSAGPRAARCAGHVVGLVHSQARCSGCPRPPVNPRGADARHAPETPPPLSLSCHGSHPLTRAPLSSAYTAGFVLAARVRFSKPSRRGLGYTVGVTPAVWGQLAGGRSPAGVLCPSVAGVQVWTAGAQGLPGGVELGLGQRGRSELPAPRTGRWWKAWGLVGPETVGTRQSLSREERASARGQAGSFREEPSGTWTVGRRSAASGTS